MFLQELTYGKKYTAIEHAEKTIFTVLKLVKKNKELQISKNETVTDFNKVIESLKEQKHVFLVFNNEHVLSKKVALTHKDENILIRDAFPSISISEFYYQVIQNKTHSFVCIARKNVIDVVIKEYKIKGISVIDFSLGNLVLQNLQPFIKNKVIISSNAKIEIGSNAIDNIQKITITSNETYSINNLGVSSKEILPLAGVISYYTKNESSIIYKKLKEQYFHKRFFDVGLKFGLGFLLVLLLANFFFFSSYRDKVGDLMGELQLSGTYKNQLNKLQEEVSQKKRLVESVQSASNSIPSKYIDVLGGSTPNTVLLSQIYFQPIEGIQKIDKPLAFKENQIVVKGISKNNEDFSNWVSDLEQKKWIENISIHEYGKGKKAGSNSAFEFIITTHDR